MKHKDDYFIMNKISDEIAEIDIFGDIVPTGWEWGADESAASFKEKLDELGSVSEIVVNINSGGGSVFEGVAIYNLLKNHPATVHVVVQGLAASIASVIAMAGDDITMNTGTTMMVHKPWSGLMGNADEMRKSADLLDGLEANITDIYEAKTGIDRETITNTIAAETWISAKDAVAQGWANKLNDQQAVMNSVSKETLKRFLNTPKELLEEAPVEHEVENTINETLVALAHEQLRQLKEKNRGI